jgi:hypothetical protein
MPRLTERVPGEADLQDGNGRCSVSCNRVLEAAADSPPKELARPDIVVKLSTDRLLLAAETRRVLLQQLSLRGLQAGGVVLPHLPLKRTCCRRRQRQAGVDGVQLRERLHRARLGGDRVITSDAKMDIVEAAKDKLFIGRPPEISTLIPPL